MKATQFDSLMYAVRSNCIRLAENAQAGGYVFGETPLGAPCADAATTFAMLDGANAPMPSALRAFYQIVGAVEFAGRPPPTWQGCDYPDPISVAPLDPQYWRGELDAWCEDPNEKFGRKFAPQMAGDHIHKAGYSGGACHIIFDDADDPTVWAPNARMHFTDYLKLSLEWGGFPGLRFCPAHSWPLNQFKQGTTALP